MGATTVDDEVRVRRLLLVAAAAVVVQTSITDYGTGNGDVARFWALIGLVALALVLWRRSRVARVFTVVTGVTGAAVHGLVALGGGGMHPVVVALSFLAQALPLVTRPVHEHVRRPATNVAPDVPTAV